MYGCCGSANSCPAGASSTIMPRYITTTRSAMSATTPMLWVIRMIAVPSRSRSSSSSSRIAACTVTSRAVVGSSAMMTSGSHEIAIAMTTRCFWPPESWCG